MSKQVATITVDIEANLKNLENQVKSASQAISKMGDGSQKSAMQANIDKLQTSISKLREKASQPVDVKSMRSIEQESAKVESSIKSLSRQLNGLSQDKRIELLPEGEKEKITKVKEAVDKYNKSIELGTKNSEKRAQAQTKLNAAQKLLAEGQKKLDTTKGKKDATQAELNRLQTIKDQIAALKEYEAQKKRVESEGGKLSTDKEYQKARRNVSGIDGFNAREPDAAAKAIERLNTVLENSENKVTELNADLDAYNAEIKQLETTNKAAESSISKFTQEISKMDAAAKSEALDELQSDLSKIDNLDLNLDTSSVEKLNDSVNNFVTSTLKEAESGTDSAKTAVNNMGQAYDELGNQVRKAGTEMDKTDQSMSNVQSMVDRIKQFTGVAGAAMFARRAFQSVINTVKELDAVMTEMAVVTDLGVGDYWQMLPEFTENANALGVSIHGAYEATTLYLQQGLKMAEAQELSNQTLKMGKIAGLEAADATDRMTAALRGFNMELNEASAEKVADVYSKLAAITASDVDEISVAMTKTASIASSAGMEFETTAAFLSQIIETTRESAETAGTAMKTVIARFQELKKDPAEIREVDGEVVDANKIETALRSVGVSLRDSSGQFRELDQVFLELSSKWQDLDTNTQRYIATIAAGSRQQSRFIAMMQDYSRTSELVTAANNSAGASNEQFNKTLESLESKLAQLKNAWDQFTMGIADSGFIKGAVDILTGLLTAINNLISAFDQIGLGAPASIALIVGALYVADAALKTFMASFASSKSIMVAFGAVGKGAIVGIGNAFKAITKIPGGLMKSFKQIGTSFKTVAAQNKVYEKNLRKTGMSQREVNKSTSAAIKISKQKTAQETKDIALEKLGVAQKKINNKETAKAIALDGTEAGSEASLTAIKAAGLAVDKAENMTDKQGLVVGGLCIAQDALETLSTRGLTKEKLLEYQATMLANGLTQDEITKRMAAIVALYAQTGAEKAQNTEQKKGLAGLWAKIVAGFIHIGVLIGQTVAQWAYNIAAIVGTSVTAGFVIVILLLVAAAIILVVAIIAVVNAIKNLVNNSPEKQLERAKEALDGVSEAAQQAQEKFQNLNDSLEELDEKYDALDSLTKGTLEWKKAVAEINSEVLDLIDEYPELAKFAENKGGVLTIDMESEGVQGVLDKYADDALAAQNAELAMKMVVNDKQHEVDYSNLSDEATIENEALAVWEKIGGIALAATGTAGAIAGGIGAGAGAAGGTLAAGPIGTVGGTLAGATAGAVLGSVGAIKGTWEDADQRLAEGRAQTELLAELMAKGNLVQDESGAWSLDNEGAKLAEQMGLTADQVVQFANQLGDSAEELRNFGEAAEQRSIQDEVYAQQMASNAVAMMDLTKYTNKQQAMIDAIADNEYAEAQTAKAKAKLADTDLDGSDGASADNRREYEKYVKEIYGENARLTDAGTIEVMNEDGEWKEKADAENTKAILANAKATEEMTKMLEHLPRGMAQANNHLLKTAGKDVAKSFESVFSGADGSEITKTDLANLQGMSQSQLEALWVESPDLQATFGDFNTFLDDYNEKINIAEQNFAAAADNLYLLGQEAENYDFGNMTSEMAKGFSEKLATVMSASGADVADSVQERMKEMEATLGSDYGAFVSQLNAIDWTNLQDWENLPNTLKQVGINVPEEQLNTFIADMSDAAGAIHKVDLSKLIEQTHNLQSILSQMRSGELTNAFDEETYNSLIGANSNLAQDFILNNEGEYVYLGSSMDNLRQAIEKQTEVLLNSTQEQLQTQIEVAEEARRWSEITGRDFNIQNFSAEGAQSDYLKGLQTQFGEELVNLGIAGFTKDTDIDTLNAEDTKKIFEELVKIVNNLETNQAKFETGERNAQVTVNLNEDIGENYASFDKYLTTGSKLSESSISDFDASALAVAEQARQAGVDQNIIDSFNEARKTMVELQKAGNTNSEEFKKAREALREYGKELTNRTGHQTMMTGLIGQMEAVSELNEQYANLETTTSKIENVVDQTSEFGIKIDESNYEEMQKLMFDFTQGNYEAYQSLITKSAQDAGLAGSNFAEIMQKVTNSAYSKLGETERAWVDALLENNLLAIEVGADGVERVVAATMSSLMEAAEIAGTIIEGWERDFNWMYNQERLAEGLSNQLDKLERSYERATNGAKALASVQEQAMVLGQQYALGQATKERAQADIKTVMDKNADFEGIFELTETGEYIINPETFSEKSQEWNELDQERFEEYASFIQEQNDLIKDGNETMEDAEDQLEELQKMGRDEFVELSDSIAEALKTEFQEQIDSLQNINDSIQSAQEALISTLQDQIKAERQKRENAQTEEDLMDAQARLSALGMDTSGANAVAMLDSQEKLDEQMQSYEDKLVDQSIAEMQDANAKAAEQRQQQIDLQQSIFDQMEKNGEFEKQAEEILRNGLDVSNGDLKKFLETEAGKLVTDALGFSSQSGTALQKSQEDLLTQFNNAYGWMTGADGNSLTTIFNNAKNEADQKIINAFGDNDNAQFTAIPKILTNAEQIQALIADQKKQEDLSTLTKEEIGTALTENSIDEDTLTKAMSVSGQGAGYYITESEDKDGNKSFSVDTEKLNNDARRFDAQTFLSNDGLYAVSDDDSRMTVTDKDVERITGKTAEEIYMEQQNSQEAEAAVTNAINQTQRVRKAEEVTNLTAGQLDVLLEDLGKGGIQSIKDGYITNYEKLGTTQQKFNDFDSNLNSFNHSGFGVTWSDLEGKGYGKDVVKKIFYQGRAGSRQSTKTLYTLRSKIGDILAEKIIRSNLERSKSSSGDGTYSMDFADDLLDRNIQTSFGGSDGIFNTWNKAGGGDNIDASGEEALWKIYSNNYGNKYWEFRQGLGFEKMANINGDMINAMTAMEKYKKHFGSLLAFKTGGIADFTGPAWLDGTKSSPELVLNARDTENFIQLKDILSEIMSDHGNNGSTSKTGQGDNYFDIEINVESLGDDYDVEQIADKIKAMIYDDSMYRNVNAVDNSR